MFFPEIDPDWQEIQQQFQNVCIMRREGRDEAAVQLMEEKLSPLLASWTSSNKDEGPMKRQRLEHLFEEEIKRVDDAWVTKNLLDDGLLKPFLNDLKQTLADIKAAAGQRPLAPLNSMDNSAPASTVDFEVALEPIRIELDSIKQTITDLRPSPPAHLDEETLRSIVDDCEAANRSREEVLITAYATMRDEIASLKQQISESNTQDQLIAEMGALKAQMSKLVEYVQTPSPKPDYSQLLQNITTALEHVLASHANQFTQPIQAIADTLNQKEDAVAESIEQNQSKYEYMHRQLLDALEAIYQEHRSESAAAIKDEFAALAAQDRAILDSANTAQRDWILRVGKSLRSEIKEARKQIHSLAHLSHSSPKTNTITPKNQ